MHEEEWEEWESLVIIPGSSGVTEYKKGSRCTVIFRSLIQYLCDSYINADYDCSPDGLAVGS